MGFFTKLSSLLTGTAQSKETKNSYPSEDYKGFTITPQPIADHGQYRIAGLIEKVTGEGEAPKQHQFIRSDMATNADQAAELTVRKCKVFIDQMGDSIFD